MSPKNTSRTLDGIVIDLQSEQEKLRDLVESALKAHHDKINDLEMKEFAALRREVRLLAARVQRIEERLGRS